MEIVVCLVTLFFFKKSVKSSLLLVTNPSIIIVYACMYSCMQALKFYLLFHGFVNRLIRYFTCIGDQRVGRSVLTAFTFVHTSAAWSRNNLADGSLSTARIFGYEWSCEPWIKVTEMQDPSSRDSSHDSPLPCVVFRVA